MMHRMIAFLASFLVLGCGPTLVFPGGALEGPTTVTPTDWGLAEEVSTIQLETRSSDPYSVNIWAVGIGDWLYVHAGTNRARWVEYMEADPLVRVRLDGQIYALRASRVEDAREFAVFAEAYEAKYGNRPRNEDVDEVYLFRLGTREG